VVPPIPPGDIVTLQTGVRVPSDMRVLASDNLRVDKSLLTGENEPVRLITDAVAKVGVIPPHPTCI
jgi:P-type E1-E2 ATPase